ncbi:MAG: STAS/SEC14 domain-containing protein [Kiritimatiellaeota bacterium]|nr:STAS/SEC14 domain-containing protein [Kiritimatiellota bacterium]
MSYSIEKTPDFVEVHIRGDTSGRDVLTVLEQLTKEYPRKEICDLWVLSSECVIPFGAFSTIVEKLKGAVANDFVGCKTALVVTDAFQMAQAAMYRHEAAALPFEIRVFMSRDQAVEWLKSGSGPTTRHHAAT